MNLFGARVTVRASQWMLLAHFSDAAGRMDEWRCYYTWDALLRALKTSDRLRIRPAVPAQTAKVEGQS
jgi:hypothetical protein